MKRRAFGPALSALFVGDRFHNDAEKVAGIPAFLHHALIDGFRLQAGALEEHALVIRVEQFAAIGAMRQVAEAQAEKVKSVALRVVNGEAPG